MTTISRLAAWLPGERSGAPASGRAGGSCRTRSRARTARPAPPAGSRGRSRRSRRRAARRAGTGCGSACRARSRPSWPPGSSRAAASSGSCRRAARSTSRQLLGPVDLEVGRRRGQSPAPARRRPGAFSSRVSALASVRRRSRWNGSPNSYGFVVSLALAAPPGAVEPVAAERVASQPREQVVEHLLADPPRRRAASAPAARRGAQVAGLLEPPGQVVERVAGPGPRPRRASSRTLVAVDRRRGRPAPRRPPSCVLERVQRLEPAELLSAPSRPAARRRRSGTRSPRPPGSSWSSVAASWARSQRSRSSRSSASIMSWSSARCSGVSEREQRLHRGHPLRRAAR